MKKQELSVCSMQGMERRSYKSPTMKACKLGSARILSGSDDSIDPKSIKAEAAAVSEELEWNY